MTDPIKVFDGPHRFLSNFYKLPEPIEWEGVLYPTTEHAFQAAKTLDQVKRKEIAEASSPGMAKRLGRALRPIRPDWEQVKVGTMEALLCLKFSHPILMRWLLETGDAPLEEGNTWGDTTWGTVNGKGRNELGKALMRVRDALRRNMPC